MNIKPITYFITILLIFSIIGCTDKKINENEALARSFIDAWSKHDVDKIISLFVDDCLYEEVASGRKFTSKKAIAGYAKSTLSGVPDTDIETVSVIASDHLAMVEWIWKGTNTVGWPSMGIPATNKYFEVRGTSVMNIENKLIKRNSDYWDWNTFMKGIGVE